MAQHTPGSLHSTQENGGVDDIDHTADQDASNDFLPSPSRFDSVDMGDGPTENTPPTANETNGANGTASSGKAQVDAQGRSLNPRSCVTCRKRKVRCDKTHPCNHCRRAHIECVFPAPGRAPRKTKKAGEGRDKELLDRLRKLESVVKGMGAEVPGDDKGASKPGPEVAMDATPVPDPISREDGQNGDGDVPLEKPSDNSEFRNKTQYIEEHRQGRFENRFGRLVINEGKSRYINNSFWASLSGEVEDLKGILNQSSDDEEDNSPRSDPVVSDNHQGWIFGFSSQNVDMLSLHPMPNRIVDYWEVYKDRVDPLVKVLHLPTVEATVLRAASHLNHLSKGFEALLFAIYYGATTSLCSRDCVAKFGEEKTVLLARYRFAVEQALARANCLTTEEAIVLQAFTIFLICLRRNSEARVIWTLTGLVVRIAQTMGIHRDGSNFGLAPFVVEMRRRLWWQVCILDTRASEDHGCDPTIIEQSFDTKMPLNVNDSDLSPDMKEYPPERLGCTDISFCLIRFEVANTFRRLNYIPPGPSKACGEFFASVTLKDKEKWITECHQRLEERYLKHCDMSVPLFWVTATVARLMMSKMWLMVYHPFQRQDGGASMPRETREKLFITSLENIEYSLLLETESRTMKWGWLFRTYMQWHALAFMLSELCHRTTGDIVERAWVAVEKTRDGRWGTSLTEDPAGHLWRPLNKLYRKAKEERARGVQEEQMAKHGANGMMVQQEKRYSPNANPMFGHPRRPQMTRAPLSNAQLTRFSEGPIYGQIPVDKHELMKSPRLAEMEGGQGEMDQMDLAQLEPAQLDRIPTQQQQLSAERFPAPFPAPTPGQAIYAPTANGGDRTMYPQKNFMSMTGDIDFAMDPEHVFTFDDYNGAGTNRTPLPDFPTEMDISGGDLNWENWDQLVQQFGMDLDKTFDHRAPVLGGEDNGGTATGNGMEAGFGTGMVMGMGPGARLDGDNFW